MIGGQISVGGHYVDLRDFDSWKTTVEKFFGCLVIEITSSKDVARNTRGDIVGEYCHNTSSDHRPSGGSVDPYSTKSVFYSLA